MLRFWGFFSQLWKKTKIKTNTVGQHRVQQNRYKYKVYSVYSYTEIKFTSLCFLSPSTFRASLASISPGATTPPGNLQLRSLPLPRKDVVRRIMCCSWEAAGG